MAPVAQHITACTDALQEAYHIVTFGSMFDLEPLDWRLSSLGSSLMAVSGIYCDPCRIRTQAQCFRNFANSKRTASGGGGPASDPGQS